MALTCSLSNEIPEEPVISPHSGAIFEKRLILKYLQENGSIDPICGKELLPEELIAVKTPAIVKPKPTTATSIPELLKSLQNEWDATVLYSFNLRQQLQTTRQELSHALYQQDAACRVVARLSKELSAAREALATLKPKATEKAADGDTELENELSEEVIEKIKAKAASLSATRKQKAKSTPAELATPEQMGHYKTTSSQTALHSVSKAGIISLDVCPTDSNKIVTGGNDHTAVIFDKKTEQILTVLKGHTKKVNNVIYHPNQKNVITSSMDSAIRVWDVESAQTSQLIHAHETPVTSMSLHATGDYILSTTTDEQWTFSDLGTGRVLLKAGDQSSNHSLNVVRFHPDGHIFGTGTSDSLIKIWDLKEKNNVANFPGHNSSISTMSFSENGYYLATAAQDSEIKLWDLRKLKNFKTIQLDEGYKVKDVFFDQTGNYLAVAGTDVRIYLNKQWDIVKVFTDHTALATGVRFGDLASFICSVSLDRSLKFYSS